MKSKNLIIISIIVVVALPAVLKRYTVRSEGSGELFWNAKEAFIFESVSQRGSRFSYWGYFFEAVREIFPFGASSPKNSHFYVVVLRITPTFVQRFTTDDFWLGGVYPFDGSLYAGNLLPGGALMRWSGSQFQRPGDEEVKRFYANSQFLPPGPSYDNLAGWSKRTAAGEVIRESPTRDIEKDSLATITVGGMSVTLVMNSGFISNEAHIDLLRPHQAPERIWYLDQRPHEVSRSEYKAMFGSD